MKQLGQYAAPRHVVAHLSDPHLIGGGGLHYGVIDNDANLRRTLDRLAAVRPAPQAIVFTGDLADRAEPDAYDTLRSIVEPFASLAISNSLRAALAGWMKTLAGQVAADGVTVNMLLPGSFATERIDSLNAREAEARGVSLAQVVSESSAEIPVGRYGDPKEFGAVAAFLASPKASYVTGQMIRIDGGVTRSL